MIWHKKLYLYISVIYKYYTRFRSLLYWTSQHRLVSWLSDHKKSSKNLPEKSSLKPPQPHLIFNPSCSGLRGLPSPPCEGDRDQRWSDHGSVALSLSFVLLFLLLAPRLDGSEPPPPPLSSPSFRFTLHSSDWVLYEGDFGWLEFPTNSLSFVGTAFPF